MKFTINWLKEYVDIDLPTVALAERLTMLGLEVDSVCDLHSGLAGIMVARVLAVQPHPNADRLVLCEVAVGDERKQVVCGAPNVRPGLITAIALPGVMMPSGMRIGKAKIRGVASEGMLCSEKELGISEEQAGIMELPEQTVIGRSLADALELEDSLIEVDLTPNRPDCACVLGIAREVAGFTGTALNIPIQGNVPELHGVDVPFAIEVAASDDCPRYAARLLRNVKIGPSPWWLRKRLLSVGLRPVNNVVDITNFVMLELGQPLHAFDFNKLAGDKIVVRRAAQGESIVTLDGVERRLNAEMLLIGDAEKPVAIAGIMGGENSEVSDGTSEILLESACFDPVSIRRTARLLNMGTEASYRFERGVDPGGTVMALERATRLIVEIAGAEVTPDGIDRCRGKMARPSITLRVSRARDLLGMALSAAEITGFLEGIAIKVEEKDADTLLVTPPTFRVDLDREIDLIEEITRLKGYNEITATLPKVHMSFPEQDESRGLVKQTAVFMAAHGFFEAINYSFVAEQHFDGLMLAADDPARTAVHLLNPLSEEQQIMRTTLLPGLLENVRRNINHQNNDIRLFEIGKVFRPRSGEALPHEQVRLSALLSGRRYPDSPLLHFGAESVDIFDVKGVVEPLLQELRIPDVTSDFGITAKEQSPPYAEASCFVILKTAAAARKLGSFGKVGCDVLRFFGIKQDVYFLDLNLEVIAGISPAAKSFASLPRFPSVKWDIAVLVPEHVAAGDMLKAVLAGNEPLVEWAEIFDVYRGKSVKSGYKSVAIAVTYRSDKQTLEDEAVNRVHQKLIKMLGRRFEAQLREAV